MILSFTLALLACPEAREARWSGAFAQAEDSARTCLAARPDDVDARLELSRSLALQGNFGPAEEEALRARSGAPDSEEIALWQARLAAWRGDLGTSATHLQLVCAHDCPSEHWRLWQQSAEGRVEVESALWTREERAALLDARVSGSVRWGRRLWLGPTAAVRWRTDAAEPEDGLLGGDMRLELSSVTLNSSLRVGLVGASLPRIDASLGMKLRRLGPFSAGLELRGLRFETGTSVVVQPSLCREWDALGLCATTSIVWIEEAVRAFGWLQSRYQASKRLTLRAGAGGGNTSDFVLLRTPVPATSASAFVGLSYLIDRRVRAGVDYAIRSETTEETVLIHRLGLGLGIHLDRGQ